MDMPRSEVLGKAGDEDIVKPLVINLSDEDRKTLEEKREKLGMRSWAELIRYWINK